MTNRHSGESRNLGVDTGLRRCDEGQAGSLRLQGRRTYLNVSLLLWIIFLTHKSILIPNYLFGSEGKPLTASTSSFTGQEGRMGEFVIKAESRVLLDSEKPLLDVDIEEISVLNKSLAMDEQALAVNAPDIGQIQRAAPLIIQSGFVIVPRHFEFRSDTTAHTFMLRRLLETVYREPDLKAAADKARWEFRLADASGSTYMEFAGRGFAPEELKVPTRNARGVVIRPGNPYAGVLTYRDSFGELHTALSETFNLPGLVERMPKGYLLHLAVSEIFGKSPAWRNSGETSPAVKLTGLGEMIFQETADWIKFHGAGLAPAEVRAYFRREAYARELANAAADQLAQRLKRVRTTILVKALEVNDPLEERLEISIQPPR